MIGIEHLKLTHSCDVVFDRFRWVLHVLICYADILACLPNTLNVLAVLLPFLLDR